MGRPRTRINVLIVAWLRSQGLGWRTIARRYYSLTGRETSWMSLKRRFMEADSSIVQDCRGINH